MKLFKNARTYVLAFSVYVLLALLSLRHSTHKVPDVHRVDQVVQISQLVGSGFIVVVFLGLTRKTSSLLEKIILAVSAMYFVLFFLEVLHKCGWVAAIPWDHAISNGILCIATAVAGVRMLQVLVFRKEIQ